MSDDPPRPKSIALLNLPVWAMETVRNSLWYYRRRKRPMTWRRLVALLWPNLKRPIFVIGAARSGTTFLGDCLATLHEVSYHHEPVATKAAARYVGEGKWSTARARRFYRLVYGWLMRLHLDADLRFAEKTPRNAPIVAFLAIAFPDAQFIHIIRDGRDVVMSHARQPWLSAKQQNSVVYEPGGYPMGPYAHFWVEPERRNEFESCSDIRRCAWAWRVFVESAQAAFLDMTDERHLELRYETIVAQPKPVAIELLDFLEIFDPESRTAFVNKVCAVHSESVGRWKDELSPSDLDEILQEAGALLARLGYAGKERAASEAASDV